MGLSIIIPAHNEELFLAETLGRIFDVLNNIGNVEVIVVNNASSDETESIASSFESVKLINLKDKSTISKTRNTGFRSSSHDVIAFIDADVLITNDWAETFINSISNLQSNPYQITGCRYSLSEKPDWLERSWFGKMKSKNSSYINSGNLITTKLVINKINGFDERLTTGEDVDFCRRAYQLGVSININTGFKAHHEGYPKTIIQFLKRERWHGSGDLASFGRFVKSKVAVFSCILTALFLTSLILFLVGQYKYGLLTISVFVVLNFYAIHKRFSARSLSDYFSLFYLHCIYCFARCTSFFVKRHR